VVFLLKLHRWPVLGVLLRLSNLTLCSDIMFISSSLTQTHVLNWVATVEYSVCVCLLISWLCVFYFAPNISLKLRLRDGMA